MIIGIVYNSKSEADTIAARITDAILQEVMPKVPRATEKSKSGFNVIVYKASFVGTAEELQEVKELLK